jgi:hypothetical protein
MYTFLYQVLDYSRLPYIPSLPAVGGAKAFLRDAFSVGPPKTLLCQLASFLVEFAL